MVRAEISYRGTTTTLSEAYIDVVYNRLDACVYIIRNSRYYYARRQVYKAENLDICYVYNQLQSEGVSGGVSQSREARRGGGCGDIAERSKRLSKTHSRFLPSQKVAAPRVSRGAEIMNIAHEFRRWNFNGLVDAEISCKNGRDTRRSRARIRAAFCFVTVTPSIAAAHYPDKRSMAGNFGWESLISVAPPDP